MSTPLPEPMEYWDMNPGESRTLEISGYERGRNTIIPRSGPNKGPKLVDHLRLHLEPGIKETLPYYWDITAKTLIAGLLPYLNAGRHMTHRFIVTKIGQGVRSRFSLDIQPK